MIYNEWTIGEVVTVDEVDWDYDLHAFVVHWMGEAVTVSPPNLEEQADMIRQLDNGECPLGWETVKGNTIRCEILERLNE